MSPKSVVLLCLPCFAMFCLLDNSSALGLTYSKSESKISLDVQSVAGVGKEVDVVTSVDWDAESESYSK